jgi:hypothetical protein
MLKLLLFVYLSVAGWAQTGPWQNGPGQSGPGQKGVLYFPVVPNEDLTPGELCTIKDPDFTTFRYAEKIPYCERSVSGGLKNEVYRAYKIPAKCISQFTVDHFIPLSIGGSNNFENLWPEHKKLKQTRLNFENEIHIAVRDGRITQRRAVELVYKTKLNPKMNPQQATYKCD